MLFTAEVIPLITGLTSSVVRRVGVISFIAGIISFVAGMSFTAGLISLTLGITSFTVGVILSIITFKNQKI